MKYLFIIITLLNFIIAQSQNCKELPNSFVDYGIAIEKENN